MQRGAKRSFFFGGRLLLLLFLLLWVFALFDLFCHLETFGWFVFHFFVFPCWKTVKEVVLFGGALGFVFGCLGG